MITERPRQRICTVYFTKDGRLAGHVTQAASLFEACRKALAWFGDPFWKGPIPGPHTILEVQVVARTEQWRVRAESRSRRHSFG